MTRFKIIISNNENVLQLQNKLQRASKRMTRFQIIISNKENVLQLQKNHKLLRSPPVSLTIIVNALCALHLLH